MTTPAQPIPHYQDDRNTVHHGDCIEVMRTLPDNSVDSIVTDPPYGLGFMGKAWDALPPGEEWARECLRVLKPGGHMLAFGGTRTWHRLAVAVEDAGFEIRDSIAWMYGSGMPKSQNVSKAMDNAAGAVRHTKRWMPKDVPADDVFSDRTATATSGNLQCPDCLKWKFAPDYCRCPRDNGPQTPDAKQWQGWGTALKPAFEPVVAGRKPFGGTVAANVIDHGTGALNIDAARYGDRWPANVILDESQAESLSQSAFFYVAKAPKRERPSVDGIAHPTVKPLTLMRYLVRLVTPAGGTVLEPFAGSGATVEACILEGFHCIAIEREGDYLPLIQARIDRQGMGTAA